MANNVVDIDQVPPDIDPLAVGVVKNPLKEEFTHAFAGKPLTLPAATVKVKEKMVEKEVEEEGKDGVKKIVKKKFKEEYEEITPSEKQFPLTVSVHLAKHLAEKIIRAEFRKRVAGIKDDKVRDIESGKPIPDYKGKIWNKMKELVETDSDFFDDGIKEGQNESNMDKFIR